MIHHTYNNGMKCILIDWNAVDRKGRWTVEDSGTLEIGERVQLWSGDEDDNTTCEAVVIDIKPAKFGVDKDIIYLELDKDSWYF